MRASESRPAREKRGGPANVLIVRGGKSAKRASAFVARAARPAEKSSAGDSGEPGRQRSRPARVPDEAPWRLAGGTRPWSRNGRRSPRSSAFGFRDPDPERRLVVAQIRGVPPPQRRPAEPARLGANRGDRRKPERLGQDDLGRDRGARLRAVAH